MNEKEERLKQLFASMDTETLVLRAQDPQITPMAKALAQAELQAREGVPVAGDSESSESEATDIAMQPQSSAGAGVIALSGLGMLLGALALKQFDVAILGVGIILIVAARLSPSVGIACGLALLLSPLWFWLAGWYDTGNWFINCVLIFLSLVPTGIGAGMLEAAFFRGSDSDFFHDLAQRVKRAESILRNRRR